MDDAILSERICVRMIQADSYMISNMYAGS